MPIVCILQLRENDVAAATQAVARYQTCLEESADTQDEYDALGENWER